VKTIIEQLFSSDSNKFCFSATVILASRSDDFSKQQAIELASQMNTQTLNIDDSILNHESVIGRVDSVNHSGVNSIQFSAPYSELIERQFNALRLQFEHH
jgi:hypothetical protein